MKARRSIPIFIVFIILAVLVFINIPEAKNKVLSPHFTFVYSSSIDSAKIRSLASGLEDNYLRISQDLNTIPAANIVVNIYASRWRYLKATKNWSASGSIEGVATLHFVEQAWSEPHVTKVAVHEFTHAVVLKLLLDKESQPLDPKSFDQKFATFPTWLWEATSVYEANQFTDPKTLPYLSGTAYPGLDELNNRSRGGKIYDVGYTIIAYMISRYGRASLASLITNYGDLQKTLKVTNEEFSKNWHLFIRDKYLLQ